MYSTIMAVYLPEARPDGQSIVCVGAIDAIDASRDARRAT
jgi:hypothetical protein